MTLSALKKKQCPIKNPQEVSMIAGKYFQSHAAFGTTNGAARREISAITSWDAANNITGLPVRCR